VIFEIKDCEFFIATTFITYERCHEDITTFKGARTESSTKLVIKPEQIFIIVVKIPAVPDTGIIITIHKVVSNNWTSIVAHYIEHVHYLEVADGFTKLFVLQESPLNGSVIFQGNNVRSLSTLSSHNRRLVNAFARNSAALDKEIPTIVVVIFKVVGLVLRELD